MSKLWLSYAAHLAVLFIYVTSAVGCGEAMRRQPFQSRSADAEYKDPSQARLDLSEPRLTAASEGGQLKVPGFVISLRGADYFDALRCASDFQLRLPDGSLLSTLGPDDPLRRDRLKWAWLNAKNDLTSCRVIALNSARDTFLDLAAPAGKWRYLAVPCVDPSALPAGERAENCSYDIATTSEFAYDGDLADEFLKVASELNLAEGRLAARLNALTLLARSIVRERELCEGAANAKKALERMTAGATALVKIAVGAVLSTMTAGTTATLLSGFLTITEQTMAGAASLVQQPSGCPALDDAAARLESVRKEMGPVTDEVMAARRKLADLDSRYEALPSTVVSEFKRVLSGTQDGASAAASTPGKE